MLVNGSGQDHGRGDEFKIFDYGVSRTYSKGELLFSYGDESDALFIVQKGEIEVFLLTEEGKKLSLNVLKPGEIFGEIGVLDGGKRTAFAEAKNRSTVKRIPRNLIVEKIRDGSDPEFAYYLINVLCSRIRWINEQVEHLAISGVEERLANKLVILHLKFSDENGVPEFVTKRIVGISWHFARNRKQDCQQLAFTGFCSTFAWCSADQGSGSAETAFWNCIGLFSRLRVNSVAWNKPAVKHLHLSCDQLDLY